MGSAEQNVTIIEQGQWGWAARILALSTLIMIHMCVCVCVCVLLDKQTTYAMTLCCQFSQERSDIFYTIFETRFLYKEAPLSTQAYCHCLSLVSLYK